MPTVFGMVALGLVVVGTLVGLVLWVRQIQHRRRPDPRPRTGAEVPYDESRAAAEQTRTVDRNGWA